MKKLIITIGMLILFAVGSAIAEEPKTLEDWKKLALDRDFQSRALIADVRWLKSEITMLQKRLGEIRMQHKQLITQESKKAADDFEKEYKEKKAAEKKASAEKKKAAEKKAAEKKENKTKKE